MEIINNFTEAELLNLKNEIDNRLRQIQEDSLDEVKRKDSVKNKTKLSQLTSKDRIFGIGFGLDRENGKFLKELDAKWSVHIVDFCDVKYTDKKNRDTEWNRIGISHKTKPFGISISIDDQEADKSYLLYLDTDSGGYDGFFTLSPQTWEKDLQEALEYKISQRKKHFKQDIKKLKSKVKLVIENKEKINLMVNSTSNN